MSGMKLPAYFDNLEQLESHFSSSVRFQLPEGLVPYHGRPTQPDADRALGEMLVCHDFKGGYTETSEGLNYTFNFWSLCDTFVYFSHHRITIPPVSWTNVAHKQGVKMLGTIIFEWEESEEDMLRLIIGPIPDSNKSIVSNSSAPSIPATRYYAVLLAELAHERGFDGYLLNVECNLRGGSEQTRALCVWISFLESELKRRVGQHSRVVWYDSVITNGQLRWQDCLCSLNLPFFLSASSIFTNYTWKPSYPTESAAYLSAVNLAAIPKQPKTHRDIYTGADVWGRGSHGGGGAGLYKALEHIEDAKKQLSVALFGQAWTWERRNLKDNDETEETWQEWWKDDLKLWAGGDHELAKYGEQAENAKNEEDPPKPQPPPCPHGPYRPISSFFSHRTPPSLHLTPFYTNFCPGVGFSWFVDGDRVKGPNGKGWTDIEKQTSLGNLLWPVPTKWDSKHGFSLFGPTSESPSIAMCFDDAWLGGSSLRLTLPSSMSTFIPGYSIPINTVSLAPNTAYTALLIYKPPERTLIDFLQVQIVPARRQHPEWIMDKQEGATISLGNGWIQTRIRADTPPSAAADGQLSEVPCVILLTFPITLDRPKPTALVEELSILLGQLVVAVEPNLAVQLQIATVEFTLINSQGTWGTLQSRSAIYLPPLISNDPDQDWERADMGLASRASILFCNVYACPAAEGDSAPTFDPLRAIFLGMSGADLSFVVTQNARLRLETSLLRPSATRFYVQAVTDKGEVRLLSESASVDVVH